jgi:hypothetical protein
MKPTNFKQQNGLLGKPKGTTDEQCGGLPVARCQDGIVSCWQLSDEEFQEVCTNGGKVYLTLFVPVENHPMVSMITHNPFSK